MFQQWYTFLYNLDLHNSSLLIAEHLHKKHYSPDTLKYIILNLFKLDCKDKILDIIEQNSSCLDDFEIRIIYYKCLIKRDSKNIGSMKNVDFDKNDRIENENYAHLYDNSIANINIPINFGTMDYKKSIEIFWKSLTKNDTTRRDFLIKSYKTCLYNIEPLFYLILEELVNTTDITNLINLNPHKEILLEIFSNVYNSEFYHPFYIFLYSKYLFSENDEFKLFNISHSSYKLYKNNIFTYLSLGLYFILKKQYKEAKKILLTYISKEPDNDLFIIYLYLGICYSKLRECENSISCFNICNKTMNCTWKSYYYLAYEYLKMTNIEKSRFFYKEGLAVDKNIKMQEGYIILLIYCEDYKEALLYLSDDECLNNEVNNINNETFCLNNVKNGNNKNISLKNKKFLINENNKKTINNENINALENDTWNLLKCYCYLFLGNINESKKYLNLCKKDYRYYCTLGYIEHLTDNIDKACDAYNKSLLLKENNVVTTLMNNAFERDKENDVYNSCTEIFEFLFINNMEIEVI